MRALGRSVLGTDIDERADAVAEPLSIALSTSPIVASRPVRAPRWLPTPPRRRAIAANATMHGWPMTSCKLPQPTPRALRHWCAR